MNVCLECGLNTAIFGDHAPGCSMFSGSLKDISSEVPEDAHNLWNMLIETAADRGQSLSKSLLLQHIKTTLGDHYSEDLGEMFFDKDTLEIISLCSWAGAMGAIQILIEQDILTSESVSKYLSLDDE